LKKLMLADNLPEYLAFQAKAAPLTESRKQ